MQDQSNCLWIRPVNCDAELTAQYSYCPHCSQRTRLHRLSMHDVAHETIHDFTHADRGLWFTLTGGIMALYISNGIFGLLE